MNNEIQHSHEVIIIKSVRFSAIIDVNNQPSKNYWNLMVESSNKICVIFVKASTNFTDG